MEPLRPSYVDLVKPHLPDTWMGGKDIFLKMIDSASFPGFRIRFWRHRYEKEQKGGWILPGYSGTVVEEAHMRRLVVIDPHAPMIAQTKNKKVKAGVEIIAFKKNSGWNTALQVSAIAYKKMKLSLNQNQKPDLSIFETIKGHTSLHEGCHQGIASPPLFLSAYRNAKKNEYYIDFEEKRALGALKREISLKGNNYVLSLFDVANGLNEIAKALLHINKKGKVHADVKCDNILVTLEGGKIHFGLTDFELLSTQYVFFRFDPVKPYVYWDKVRSHFKLATPFCDVFGFAQSLGSILFGNPFNEIKHKDDIQLLDKLFENLKERQKGKPFEDTYIKFFYKAYLFIRQVKCVDSARAKMLLGQENALHLNESLQLLVSWLPDIKIEACVSLTVELIKILRD